MMKTTNIFMNAYEQPENKLTYSFLSLFEHLSIETYQIILSKIGISLNSIDFISIDLVYGGGKANPDGSIRINPETDNELIIYFENKTWRRKLDIPQIKRHIDEYIKNTDNFLLVITAERNDKDKLEELNDKHILFITWHELVDYLHQIADTSADLKDSFILNQFVDYTEKSGEAWRTKMIDEKLINSVSKVLELTNDIDQFYKNGWRLMNSLNDEIIESYSHQIQSSKIANHWGRLGAECELINNSLGQWLFFGIYHNTKDHLIKFKQPYQPEYAVFLDINPKNRQTLIDCKGIIDSIVELKKQGFEFNFPENKTGNPWRVCYWRETMIKYVNSDVSDIRIALEEQLKILFNSNFYKILKSIN